MNDQFWTALGCLQRWQRQNLPNNGSAVSSHVLAWLIRCRREPRPLSELFLSTNCPEPAVREVLQAYVQAGLVAFDLHKKHGLPCPAPAFTAKFDQLLAEYRRQWKRLGDLARDRDQQSLLEGIDDSTAPDALSPR